MRIDILTLFPEMFAPLFSSIPARAQNSGKIILKLHNLRDYGRGRHRQVDDVPFGGGSGMVLQAEPLARAIRDISAQGEGIPHVVFMSPQGHPLCQKLVERTAIMPRLLLICGHYEGIDERIIETFVDEEISIGDYILSGGEIPAMVLADSVIRLVDGVISADSAAEESFSTGLLDYPHYSRPAVFEGIPVPQVLTTGNHKLIEDWRHNQSLLETNRKRPDLLAHRKLSKQERQMLEENRNPID